MPTTESTRRAVLRVGTFNVRWDAPEDEYRWERRRARSVQMLREWGPDVLGLQEPLHSQVTQIAEGLPEYTVVGVGRQDGREGGEFCPILYRTSRFDLQESGTFWLSETPSLPGSATWGNRIPRICTWVRLMDRETGREFSLYNVHLDHESQPAREKSAQLLVNTLKERSGHGPTVVTGDFNAHPDNPAIQRLQADDSPAPVSALDSVHGTPAGTFHGFSGQASGGPIDYIFVSPNWQVLEAEVLTGGRSEAVSLRPFPRHRDAPRRTA